MKSDFLMIHKHIKCGTGFLFLCNGWLKTKDSVEILNSSAPAVRQQIHQIKINAEQGDEFCHKLFFLFRNWCLLDIDEICRKCIHRSRGW